MAATDIKAIWDKALGNAGAKTSLTAITEESAEAAACAIHYPEVVRELMRAADWNFNRRRVALTEVPTGAVWPPSWEYMYLYPVDCMAIRGFDLGAPPRYFPYNEVPFEAGNDATAGRVIYMNESPSPVMIYTSYTWDSGNGFWEARFDPSFRVAVEWGLANAIAAQLGAGAATIQRCEIKARESRLEAMAANGNEAAPISMDQAQAESLLVRGLLSPYQMPWPSTF